MSETVQIYLVGGAVRDALMGLPVQDRDWVVVGATPQMLLDQGYLPVGRDFPVFLHPDSKEEYALARTERNTAPGYHGFAINAAPGVTLEEDLQRRDLTINAIAVASAHASPTANWANNGALVDPFGGRQDIANKVLRHVSLAFCEDPVRILRLARFAARFADFHVASETLELMRRMVEQGETNHLVAERVWQELSRGLMETKPSRMFAVLRECDALARLLPEIDALWRTPLDGSADTGTHAMQVLDLCAQVQAPLEVRFACLLQHVGDAQHNANTIKDLCERLRIPVDCKELAEVVAREQHAIRDSGALDAPAIVRLLERCDAFRKPARFQGIMQACACDALVDTRLPGVIYPPAVRLGAALARAQSVATDQVALAAQRAGATGQEIGVWIRKHRADAVAAGL